MRTLYTVGCLLLVQFAQGAFAQNKQYFSGQQFESAKSVQLVGAPRTAENVEREDHIGKIIELHRNQLRYCYERALARADLGAVAGVFYFTVSGDGTFANVSADLTGKEKATQDNDLVPLFSCVSQQVQNFRAAKANVENTFRFMVRFSAQ